MASFSKPRVALQKNADETDYDIGVSISGGKLFFPEKCGENFDAGKGKPKRCSPRLLFLQKAIC
jgi:hypothetical protein